VATRFYALGALPFLADRARGLDKLSATLGQEWDDLATLVEPSVREGDYDAAVAIVEDHLIERLLTAKVDLKKIQSAAKMLYLQKGQFRVSDLAEHCNLSSRQLQRQFQDVVGVSAKTLARSIRFEEIRKRLMLDPDQSLTALAYELGYADQAHFIHDFKEFADRTPGESPAKCGPSRPFSATARTSFFYKPRRLTAARLAAQSNPPNGRYSDEQGEDHQRAGPRPGRGHRVLYAETWFRAP
jgi:AraC-like DNA-binding protein